MNICEAPGFSVGAIELKQIAQDSSGSALHHGFWIGENDPETAEIQKATHFTPFHAKKAARQ